MQVLAPSAVKEAETDTCTVLQLQQQDMHTFALPVGMK